MAQGISDVSASPPKPDGAGGLGRVVRGFGALAASSVTSQVIAFAALAYVARKVGASNLGAYTFALLLATYFNLLASAGINYLATRDLSQDRTLVGSIVGESLMLQGLLSAVFYIALLALAPLLTANHEVQRIVPIVGLTILTSTFTLDWALLALGKSGRVAIWRLVGQVTYASLIPVLVVGGESGVVRYAWLNVMGLVATAGGVMWVFFRVTTARLRVSRPQALTRRLRRSLPFGYSLIMIQIYAGGGTLLLGYLASTHAVGIYAVASKLPWALIVLANMWLNVFFPYTAQRLATDPQSFAHDLGQIITATLVIAAAIVVGAFLCAGTLITTMFGSSFQEASEPFALLCVAAALVLLQANFSNVLLAAGSQRYYVIVMTATAAVMVVLNLALIPLFGTIGAGIAAILGEMCLTTGTFVGVRRRLGPIPLERRRLLRGGVAVAIMGLAMFAARSVGGAAVQIGVALVAFAFAALVLRAFDPDLVRRAEAIAH
jgi:O-antigen/teichoic acid export membrane protein